MRVTYYALKEIKVGNDTRRPGDLVPEARDWPYLAANVREGVLAPVLVATLPVEVQEVLVQWEADQASPVTQLPKREDRGDKSGDAKPDKGMSKAAAAG